MDEQLARFKDALTGPVATVRTPFLADGEVDFAGLDRYVEFVIEAGSRSVVLTHGDSLFSLLTEDEIARVTQRVIDTTAGRAMVCAATGIWPTAFSAAFSERCREWGADMVMVLPPDWGKSCEVDELVAHYAACAEALPVMVVTNYLNPRGTSFGMRAIEALRDRVPGIFAVKDDVCGDFGRRLSTAVYDRWAVFVGGQKRNHLNVAHYGCDGFLSTFLTFKPEVAHGYWNAVKSGDFTEAVNVITRFEVPLFDSLLALPGGFDAGLHGVYELAGIYGRYRRAPYHSLTDKEMEVVADVCRTLDIIS